MRLVWIPLLLTPLVLEIGCAHHQSQAAPSPVVVAAEPTRSATTPPTQVVREEPKSHLVEIALYTRVGRMRLQGDALKDVFDALRARNVALCIADSEKMSTPVERTADYGYFRLRDEGYQQADIERWAATVVVACHV